MSYQTIPIVTRIKYNPGWFQEYFPQTTLTYRRSVSFFNKNYSYMIFFFWKKKFNLLKHEMIFDNKFVMVSCFTVQVELIKHFSSKTQGIKKLDLFTCGEVIVIKKYLSIYKIKHIRFIFFFKKSILKNVSRRFLSIKKHNLLKLQKSDFFSYCTTNSKHKSYLFCCLKKSSFLQETDFRKKKCLYKNKKKSLLETKYILYKVKRQKKTPFVQKKMRNLFIIFVFTHVKQKLHLCVNTKRILSSKKNRGHIGVLKFKRFKKLKTIRNILRANISFYEYNTLHVFGKYIKSFFQKKVKGQRIFFALFKTLIINTRPVGIIKYQLNVKGKVNSRPKNKKKVIGILPHSSKKLNDEHN